MVGDNEGLCAMEPRWYSRTQCYIHVPSFRVVGLLVLEKIFKVFTIYGHGGHVVHVTKTI